MTLLRFIWLLTRPVLETLALIPLIVAWPVLAVILGVWVTWRRAKGLSSPTEV